jgi:hypothetical protein
MKVVATLHIKSMLKSIIPSSDDVHNIQFYIRDAFTNGTPPVIASTNTAEW